MKIALIFNHAYPLTTGKYFERVFKERQIPYDHFVIDGEETIPKGFDLYLRIDHGDYEFDIPQDLHPAIFYVIDTHLKKPYKKIRRQIKHYDIVFCAQKQGVEKLRRGTDVDIRWLPMACDPQIHKKSDILKRYDIGFVGSNALKFDRGKYLALLKEKYPNSFIGMIESSKMGEIYGASRIGFNSSVADDINLRTFEIMGCGCFLLTNKINGNGFTDLFEEGKHLVTYNNDRELLERIDYYLKNEDQREKIAQEGCRLVHSQHTFSHRVQTMFDYIASKLGGEFKKLKI